METKSCKRKMTNLSVAWIDYKKFYNTVLHTWILQCLRILKAVDDIRIVIEKWTKNWKVELTSGGEKLNEVKINRGICKGESWSPILFLITLILLSKLLGDMKAEYMLGEFRGKITHLLFIDDLKVYGKMMQELDSLLQTVRIFSSDIGMQFGISKWAMLEMKMGKGVQVKEIELPMKKRQNH